MISKIEIPLETVNKLKFPVLAKNKKQDFIVLFIATGSGVVIYSNFDYYSVGNHSPRWRPVYDQEEWQILPPGSKVTLIQE